MCRGRKVLQTPAVNENGGEWGAVLQDRLHPLGFIEHIPAKRAFRPSPRPWGEISMASELDVNSRIQTATEIDSVSAVIRD